MNATEMGVLIPIFIPLAFFAMIFGIFYLRSQEKMGMIERGMDPRTNTPKQFNHSYTLTAGFLLAGAGLGLFLAAYIAHQNPEDNATATYMSLASLFGGIGLVIAYFIEKKSSSKETEV